MSTLCAGAGERLRRAYPYDRGLLAQPLLQRRRRLPCPNATTATDETTIRRLQEKEKQAFGRPSSISSRTSSVPVATVMVRGRGGARACLQNRR